MIFLILINIKWGYINSVLANYISKEIELDKCTINTCFVKINKKHEHETTITNKHMHIQKQQLTLCIKINIQYVLQNNAENNNVLYFNFLKWRVV